MPNAARIRPLARGDQDFLVEALYVALWDPPDVPRRPRSVLQLPRITIYVEDWSLRPHDLGFAALDEGGTPIAAVWSRLLVPPNEGGAFFDSATPQVGIAVFPDFQGRGFGWQLMDHHLKAARERYSRISLSVHPANTRAIRLYQRAGFVDFAVGGGGYRNMVCHLDPLVTHQDN